MLTPKEVHHSRAQSVLDNGNTLFASAWNRYPKRFVHGTP